MEPSILKEAIRPMHLILREGIYYINLLLRGEETSIALHGVSSLPAAHEACRALFARLFPANAGLEVHFALAASA